MKGKTSLDYIEWTMIRLQRTIDASQTQDTPTPEQFWDAAYDYGSSNMSSTEPSSLHKMLSSGTYFQSNLPFTLLIRRQYYLQGASRSQVTPCGSEDAIEVIADSASTHRESGAFGTRRAIWQIHC